MGGGGRVALFNFVGQSMSRKIISPSPRFLPTPRLAMVSSPQQSLVLLILMVGTCNIPSTSSSVTSTPRLGTGDVTKGDFFRKSYKGGRGHFQSKKLCCRFWTLKQGFFGHFLKKKIATWFLKMRGRESEAVLNFFKNPSVLIAPPVPYHHNDHRNQLHPPNKKKHPVHDVLMLLGMPRSLYAKWQTNVTGN